MKKQWLQLIFIAYVTKIERVMGVCLEYAGTMRARMELVNLARKELVDSL